MSGSVRRMALTNGGEPPLGISVRCATTANITIATALNSGDTLDGVTLANGDLALVKDQSSPAQNGIYMVGPTPVRWRAFDAYRDYPGRIISVEEGTANANTIWFCSSDRGGTLGSTALTFARLPGPSEAAFSAYLDAIFTGEANDQFIGRAGGVWTNRTAAQVRTSLNLTDEEIQDLIGAMVSGGTETGISVTYDDTNARFDFVVSAASQAQQEAATSVVDFVTPGRQHFHPSAAKAWCAFDVSGGLGQSYNIASITDNGTGNWTVNIATDFSATNYAGVCSGGTAAGVAFVIFNVASLAAGTFQIFGGDGALNFRDPNAANYISFVAFGDQ